jgi:hypothetical protein
MAERYKGEAIFRFVYVSEAHSSVEKTDEQVCSLVEQHPSPWVTLRDTEADDAEIAYNAWPMRLVILKDGRVAHDAGRGVNPTWDLDDVEDHLRAALAVPDKWGTTAAAAGSDSRGTVAIPGVRVTGPRSPQGHNERSADDVSDAGWFGWNLPSAFLHLALQLPSTPTCGQPAHLSGGRKATRRRVAFPEWLQI